MKNRKSYYNSKLHCVLLFFCVCVSCRILYSFAGYLYVHVSGSRSITSVGEERAYLSAIVYL